MDHWSCQQLKGLLQCLETPPPPLRMTSNTIPPVPIKFLFLSSLQHSERTGAAMFCSLEHRNVTTHNSTHDRANHIPSLWRNARSIPTEKPALHEYENGKQQQGKGVHESGYGIPPRSQGNPRRIKDSNRGAAPRTPPLHAPPIPHTPTLQRETGARGGNLSMSICQ